MIPKQKTLAATLPMLFCLTVLGVMGCTRKEVGKTIPFPTSDEIAGWTRTGDIRTFPAADLWKYIDGDAERYLRAGVKMASTADYKFGGKFDAVLDIYTMAGAAGAQTIFESEPAVDSMSVQAGDAARLFGQSLVLRKGRFLVRITAYEQFRDIQPALLNLARGVERRLND